MRTAAPRGMFPAFSASVSIALAYSQKVAQPGVRAMASGQLKHRYGQRIVRGSFRR